MRKHLHPPGFLCMFCLHLQASFEWTPKAPVPAPLSSSSSIAGVPVHLDLLSSSSARQNAVASAAATGHPKLSAILSSSSIQRSVSQMQGFIDSFSGLRHLDALLHGPVLGSGSSTNEVLPVKLLREFDNATHLKSGAGFADFLSRLPSISVAGIAAPAAERLVHPELASVYSRLAAGITSLSAGLRGQAASAGTVPTLKLLHYSQVAFGRLDTAWEQAVQQQKQKDQQMLL
jgi:hypothetical protein